MRRAPHRITFHINDMKSLTLPESDCPGQERVSVQVKHLHALTDGVGLERKVDCRCQARPAKFRDDEQAHYFHDVTLPKIQLREPAVVGQIADRGDALPASPGYQKPAAACLAVHLSEPDKVVRNDGGIEHRKYLRPGTHDKIHYTRDVPSLDGNDFYIRHGQHSVKVEVAS